jgi:hypothetical protein
MHLLYGAIAILEASSAIYDYQICRIGVAAEEALLAAVCCIDRILSRARRTIYQPASCAVSEVALIHDTAESVHHGLSRIVME